MGMQTGGSGRTLSDINVTPLVDVMLVLLIIFMVTAPLIQQGVQVELPKAKAQSMDVKEQRIIITLTKQRKIYLGEAEIPFASLSDKLVGNLRLQKDKEVFLHADKSLPYGFVVEVMAILKDSGVENLGMVTDPVVREQN